MIRLLVICLLSAQILQAQKKYVFQRPEMGSPFTITLYSTDSASAAAAAEAAFHKAEELNALLSDYIDSSEINRLSAASGQHRWIPVSPALFDILQRSMRAARLSGGSYDITIGPVVRLWRQARKTHQFPDSATLREALARTGYQYLRLDTVTRSVWLEKKGMQLDVGGLGKGFVAQAAMDLLEQQGFPIAMVNAGGKIVVGQTLPGKAGWLIGINAPGEKETLLPSFLLLKNMAVATSGDIYQYVELNGKRYSHIVDPATGIGLTRRRNVTALAGDGTTADWLATACSVLPWRKSLRLIRMLPGTALLVTEMKNGKISSKSSPGFRNYLQK
ncbi:FAD:protein FMN transferase [Flavitalea sp. BT771]|uniref:FAD:protein FMN transferase n=1 Tax=Flavitalea sp. BT771 TaxID=3063329 RepID=UPI0026E344B8|nr:FAD:protein FMN transferase [Flavitalea sp. BT771]MDO6434659.1 FAD:protein FMN transferase [Flavitalea sp. BT771]MDV6223559.1 FAD:protein FMN transferase [Flavitalea sp. BT771]